MKSINLLILMIVIAFNSISAQFLSIQGVLRNENGSTVEDGVKSFRFTVYDAATGGNGIWQEIKDQMQITNGVYTHTLGSIEDFSDADPPFDYSQEYWLAIKIDNGPELTPRTKLTMTPTSNSVVAGTNNVFPSDGNVGVGTTSPEMALDVRGNAAVRKLFSSVLNNSGNEVLAFRSRSIAGVYKDAVYLGGRAHTVIGSGGFALNWNFMDSDADFTGSLNQRNLFLGSDYAIDFYVSDNDFANRLLALKIDYNGRAKFYGDIWTSNDGTFRTETENRVWMKPNDSSGWMQTWMATSGWKIKDNEGNNSVIINDNGNVGIGDDTTPDAKLDVQGDLMVDGSIMNGQGEKQWRLVKIEEFGGESHGWTHNGTNANLTTLCDGNRIFGGYNQVSTNLERIQKTWTPPAGTQHVKVVMEVYALDSWDAEWMWVALYENIKGAAGLFSQQHHYGWDSDYSGVDHNVCGAIYDDHQYRAEVSARYDGSGAIKIIVSNNLNEAPNTESIGIDNVEFWVR